MSLFTQPSAGSDYVMGFEVAADVLATAGESVNVDISSMSSGSSVDSAASKAFSVAARAPVALTGSGGGSIAAASDSYLYQFIPASTTTQFVQFKPGAAEPGGVVGVVLPSSGKYAEQLGRFVMRFGLEPTGTDLLYLVMTAGDGSLAPLPSVPPPYAFNLTVTATPCTAFDATTSQATFANPVPLSTLPALATSNYGQGANQSGQWYQLTAKGPTIHAATGGDGLSDMQIAIFDADGTTMLIQSTEDDYHKDIATTDATAGTMYFVKVTAGPRFMPVHSGYVLFVESE